MSPKTIAAGLVTVVTLTAAGGYALVQSRGGSAGPTTTTDPPTTLPPAGPAVGQLGIVIDGGADLSTDATVRVSIDPPAGAAEMQLGTDPDFAGVAWQPVTTSVDLAVTDSGYQMVFARARAANGEPGPVAVAGITIDLTWDEATAANDGGLHRASWARLLAPDVLQVRVETGRRQWTDDGWVPLGADLDLTPLREPTNYRFDDASIEVRSVSIVARPLDDSGFAGPLPVSYDLSLQLGAPLPVDTALELTVEGSSLEPVAVEIDPTVTPSPAVQVNQVGFAPGDGRKAAYVSAWIGDGGGLDLVDALPFGVYDDATDELVLEGVTSRREPGLNGDWNKGRDLTGAEVLEADFSALQAEGRYRVCVGDIGCSPTFSVSANDTWRHTVVDVARAMYQQRTGVALGPPFTSVVRPRPFHPDDGVVFERVSLTMLDRLDNPGVDDRFEEYPGAVTGEVVPDAWGGHFDAGDWNSRVQHLAFLDDALDLVEHYPEVFEELSLGIPESGNDIPDVIDEGLWDLDLFRRLQLPDGSVPGQVDQGRFAEKPETSWSNDIRVYVYSPDVWSTYAYVTVAAHAADVLETYDPALAAQYRESAERAMAWAESTWAVDPLQAERSGAVGPQRAAAAASMLALTGDRSWDAVFVEAGPFDESSMPLLDCPGPLCTAAWRYAQIDPSLVTPSAQANALQSFVLHADALVDAQATSAYPWLIERPDLPIIWGLGPTVPHGVAVLRAFVLTGDDRYRNAALDGASYVLGANPLGTSFVTGTGTSPVRNPLIVDVVDAGLPVWPGVPVFGIHDLTFDGSDDWMEEDLRNRGIMPDPLAVPLLRSWYDIARYPQLSEFTVERSIASALWTFGVLAGSA